MKASNGIYFENLDGLRFIAFLSIFLHHGIYTQSQDVAQSPVFKATEFLTAPSYLGVPFFFCLSGFLITYLLCNEWKKFGEINVQKFYLRRILRIWPLYYAVIIFGFFVFPFLRSLFGLADYIEPAHLTNYALFLSNFDQLYNGEPYGAGLGVTWSLAVEEQFYLVWPFLFAVLKPKNLWALSFLLFVLSSVLMEFFDVSYLHTLGSMSDISVGCFMALSIQLKKEKLHWLIQRSKLQIIGIYLLGILHVYLHANFQIGHRFITSLFMGFVIFEQCFCKHSFIKMKRFKTLSFIGTFTYGLYLLHTICNFISINVLEKIGFTGTVFSDLFIFPALSFVLSIVLGYLSFRFFESPFLRLKTKIAYPQKK